MLKMKKFYTTFGMLAAMAVASAANVSGVIPELQNVAKMIPAEKMAVKKAAPAKASAKAASVDDLLGNYIWIGWGCLENSTGYEQGDMQLAKDGNDIVAYGLNVFTDARIKATVDVSAGTVSFPAKVLLLDESYGLGGNVYFEHMKWTDSGDDVVSVDSPLVLNIAENGVLQYSNEFDLIALSVYSDNELLGYYRLYQVSEFVKRPATLDNEGWEDYGTATLNNFWYSNCPYFDVNADSYKVKVQRSVEDKNFIRLVNPFGEGTPFADYNLSAAEGALVFDLTYPDCVVAMGLEEMLIGYNQSGEEVTLTAGRWAGFMTSNEANYPFNYSDTYILYGFTQEDIIDEMDPDELAVYDPENMTITVVDAVFSNSFSVSQGKVYGGWDDTTMAIPTIVLDGGAGVEGVEGIEFDDNAPVRYYNLQGVEIANPQNGQLVIKKQGSKAQKMIVK